MFLLFIISVLLQVVCVSEDGLANITGLEKLQLASAVPECPVAQAIPTARGPSAMSRTDTRHILSSIPLQEHATHR